MDGFAFFILTKQNACLEETGICTIWFDQFNGDIQHFQQLKNSYDTFFLPFPQ